jgi:radical SAM superfamily enzyme YgiQ (UPF0313 family)
MHVILADPPSSGIGKLQQAPNLGLLYISSYIKRAIPGIVVHYLPEKYSREQHARLIREHDVQIYGISITSYSALRAYEVIGYLKERFPRLTIVCGGPHPSAVPIEVAHKPGVDVCVMGEGEVTFADLVRAAALPNAFKSVPGIAYVQDGKYTVNAARPFVPDIDTFPFPDRSLVNNKDFAGLPIARGKPTADMVVTRGCPYRCIFCSNPVFRPEELRRKQEEMTPPPFELGPAVGKSLRMRSPQSIALEADQLYQLGYREIYLHSDELNCNEQWSIEVCDALSALSHRDLFFQTNIRADKVSREFAQALKRMNMWLVRLGVESSSPRVMKAQKKKVSLEQVESACAILSEEGLKVFGYFMMFQLWEDSSGLQYETPDEVAMTIDFAESLRTRGHLHYMGWAVATPIQGAAMYTIARRHGLIDELFYPSHRWHLTKHLKTVSERQFNQLLKRGLRLQAGLAITNGGIGWGNWRRILSKGMRLAWGNNAPRISDFSG